MIFKLENKNQNLTKIKKAYGVKRERCNDFFYKNIHKKYFRLGKKFYIRESLASGAPS